MKVDLKWLLFVGLILPIGAAAAEPSPDALTIWSFEQGVTNRWGGQYNVYMREPSWARTYLDPPTIRSSSGHSLRVTAHRETEGFCGLWLDFYPGGEAPRRHLDASAYRFLSFWLKGQKGGEDFEIEMTDEGTVADEEARPRRPLRAYLPQGASTKWQEVLVPLADFHGLERARLVRLTLNIPKPGDHRFYLDDIALKREATSVVRVENPAGATKPGVSARNIHRAMWAWNTALLSRAAHKEAMDQFFSFCTANHIGTVYLAVEFDQGTKGGVPHFEVRVAEGYREFLARAHQLSLQVEGLAGTPEWAVRENHPVALAAVDAIVEFNRSSSPSARFDGIHYDVEPYVLVGHFDPQLRTEILTDFIEMVSRCASRARSKGGLRFSCDVPAWFYPGGGLERERVVVTFQGEAKPVGEHITDLLESVTIMDYTNEADGAGGIISRGLPALAYAASREESRRGIRDLFRAGQHGLVCLRSSGCGIPATLSDQRASEPFALGGFSHVSVF